MVGVVMLYVLSVFTAMTGGGGHSEFQHEYVEFPPFHTSFPPLKLTKWLT
jgi:hypothetical protein